MAKVLTVLYGEVDKQIELWNSEVGKFNWAETGSGGITVSAEPPRAPGQPRPAGSNPALQALSESLKSASKAGVAQAKEAAAAKAEQ